jgi:hypothetical protein
MPLALRAPVEPKYAAEELYGVSRRTRAARSTSAK